jgi:Uma2 family endonuclease
LKKCDTHYSFFLLINFIFIICYHKYSIDLKSKITSGGQKMLTVMRRYFTLEEYHRLGDLGFFGEEERVELIRGEIIQMPTKKPPHSVCNTILVQQLILLLGKQAIVRGQEPIILPGDSEPQPDVAIVRNQEDNYLSLPSPS